MKLPVSAVPTSTGWESTGVSFEDFGKMHSITRKPSGERRLPTPDWAMSNRALRKVLVHFMEERAGFRQPQKGNFKERLEASKSRIIAKRERQQLTLDKLCREYVDIKNRGLKPDITDREWNASREQPYMPGFEGEARFEDEMRRRKELETQIEGIDTYLRYTVNGGAEVVAAIVYLYYRVGYDSVNVAAELSLKPPHVRRILFNLHRTVESLQLTRNTSQRKLGGKVRTKKADKLRNGTRVPKKHFTPPIF